MEHYRDNGDADSSAALIEHTADTHDCGHPIGHQFNKSIVYRRSDNTEEP